MKNLINSIYVHVDGNVKYMINSVYVHVDGNVKYMGRKIILPPDRRSLLLKL